MEGTPRLPDSTLKTKQETLIQKERDFHEKRWQEGSDKSGFLNLNKKTPYALMWEEARREDVNFEKRQSEEFAAWQENLKIVIANLIERAQNPEKSNKRTLIVVMGGGMKCAYGAGQVMALNTLGITADKVDAVVGASGGAVVATAYVGGEEKTFETAELMAKTMCSTDFIDPTSLKRHKDGRVIDLGMFSETMIRTGVINEEEIRNRGTELWYTMTLPTAGDENPPVRFLNAQDPKEVPSIAEALKVTMSLHPKLTGPVDTIKGVEYRDGAINPLPIAEIIEHFKPTDVLILPQLPFEFLDNIEPSVGERIGSTVAKVAGFNTVAKGLVSKTELRKSLEYIQQQAQVNIGVMWPPDGGLGTLSINRDEFKASVIASYRDTFEQFEAGEPSKLPFLNNTKND